MKSNALPLFYQRVGDNILGDVVKEACPIDQEEACVAQPITAIEMNGLRYAAGYVPRALLKKLKKSANPMKDQLQVCLWDLLDDENEGGTADDWIKTIERSGLTHVNEMTFQVFLAMEIELRKHLIIKQRSINLEKACGHVMESGDVQLYWSVVSADWEEDESKTLLRLVVELFITIRGFSDASAWEEKFKN